jgi:hypothetical protein
MGCDPVEVEGGRGTAGCGGRRKAPAGGEAGDGASPIYTRRESPGVERFLILLALAARSKALDLGNQEV